MNKKVKELIDYLREETSSGYNDEFSVSELMEMGFTPEVIEEALRFFHTEDSFLEPAYNRILSEAEKLNLNVEAQGYLFELINNRHISETLLGFILESILVESNDLAGVDDINRIISSYPASRILAGIEKKNINIIN
ncbi:MAG: DUF494 family protein [Candidatus Latescibacteria bacterium]|jgi:uncharacterized protein Smg (DUF494 family)|nr:DUF494 family protein [bacterium]MBD3423085.1 DUF494 family protein [Candidatus Latescibacterota bacterium]